MEQHTPIEYWQEMHGRYEEWIDQFNACPVLRLNINEYDLMQDEASHRTSYKTDCRIYGANQVVAKCIKRKTTGYPVVF